MPNSINQPYQTYEVEIEWLKETSKPTIYSGVFIRNSRPGMFSYPTIMKRLK
jgi:hypothetical protein